MKTGSWAWAVSSLAWAISMGAQAQSVDVLTHHYNNARTGLNASETRLSPSTVKPSGFGKLFSHAVDGPMYAQPLYVSKLAIPGKGLRNVVFVATENDTVYAFDADNASGSNAQPLWQVSLLDSAHGAASGATPVPIADFGTNAKGEALCGNIYPAVGVTSTPVIDKATRTLYVEAKSKENGAIVHRLHALDLTTGKEKTGSPVPIPGNLAMPETFDPLWQLNRPALLLDRQTVYVGFGSHCDGFGQHKYRGWMFSFDARTLAPKAVLPLTRGTGNAGSIWMAGAGPAADAQGQVFIASGEGDFDGVQNFGDSILKLDGSTLAVKEAFSPPDNAQLYADDADVGSGGTLLLPDQPGPNPHLLVQATKDGRIHLLNRDRMAGGQVVQAFPKGTLGMAQPDRTPDWSGLFGLPSYWNQKLYFWGVGDVLKVFSLNNGKLDPTPRKGTVVYPYPGANMTISANGTKGGVLWTIRRGAGSDAGLLQAWDANTLALLYSSDQQAGDDMGIAVKFSTPTVANGKVFVGGNDGLTVYGRRFKLFGNWVPLY